VTASRTALLGALLAALAPAVPAEAQTTARRDPFVEEIVAIRAKHIETAGKGVIENGVIVIRNGKITAVGTDAKIPVGARVIQADTVMPGIVGGYSRIGLSAGGGAPVAGGGGFGGGGRFGGGGASGGGRAVANAHYRVIDELYPYDENYERLLRLGVTTLGLVPAGQGISGQGALVRPAAETAEKMALSPNGPLAIDFSPETQTQDLIRTTLESGRGGGQTPTGRPGGVRPPAIFPDDFSAEESGDTDDFQRGQRRGFTGPPAGGFTLPGASSMLPRRQAAARAVGGEVPTVISCDDAAGTVYALQLFQPFDRLKPVFVLPADSYRIADLLAQKKASVVIPADITFEPNTRNRINVPALLAKAGVKIACRPPSDNVEGYDGLRFKMSELIRGGLDRDTALKAITLHPAEMLGISDRVGTIETGRDANLILLDGDPFSALSRVRRVLLEGKEVYVDR
jgi:hypothetical protein